MNADQVQTLVLRSPSGRAVAHAIVRIPDHRGRQAAALLASHMTPSYGLEGATSTCRSIGFSFAGLEALRVPTGYLSLFRRLAPAFAAGAVNRSVYLGDGGASGAPNWEAPFRKEFAHVVLSWHGERCAVEAAARKFILHWTRTFRHALRGTVASGDDAKRSRQAGLLVGERLGAPPNESGDWVHFGFRDGISEVRIENDPAWPLAPDCREFEPGVLILGDVNRAGANPFALGQAPSKVRRFFHDSSFGIVRPMAQELKAFEEALDRWVAAMSTAIGATRATRDFVKAKLCGRWPNGKVLIPGTFAPHGNSLVLDVGKDSAGEGCPFGSHVRRMRAAPDRYGNVYERPLQRRSFPFGPAAWSDRRPSDGVERGLIGHFFCANIEDQFEHLVGQWAARSPLGFARDDRALDPLGGPHEDPDAALGVPLQGFPTQWLRGFGAWTTTRGTMYAWHPGKDGLRALLTEDFVPRNDEGPWL